jgi:hypothetical protein
VSARKLGENFAIPFLSLGETAGLMVPAGEVEDLLEGELRHSRLNCNRAR